ncbi:MAG TPA: hypothetical protein VI359_07360, partial [Nitrospiraceae bacterium]
PAHATLVQRGVARFLQRQRLARHAISILKGDRPQVASGVREGNVSARRFGSALGRDIPQEIVQSPEEDQEF